MGSVSFSLEGQTTVITGGSKNIGAGIAQAFAEAGSDLLLVARGLAALDEVAAKIRSGTGRRVETVSADVADPRGASMIVEAAYDLFPKVDTLINNARDNGGAAPTSIFDAEDDLWMDVFQANLFGPARLSRLFGARMLQNDGGNIINILSGSGFLPTKGRAPYGSSKAALWFLTRCLADEGAPTVRANAVCPGGVTETGVPRSKSQEHHLTMVPMGRLGLPHEIAGAAVYLASPAASYTTGAVIVVNGARPW